MLSEEISVEFEIQEKEKVKKETAKRETEEQEERKKFVAMTEREKRAMAVERRLAGLPPVLRCHQVSIKR